MTREEIIRSVCNCLDQHHRGVRGSMHQEPYKGDFFRLFSEARRLGYLTESGPGERVLNATVLTEIVVERWYTDDEVDNEKKQKLLSQLYDFWSEWEYALEHYDDK